MAKYVVPPSGIKPILIKCRNCKTLYAPDGMSKHWTGKFEQCPICGDDYNGGDQVIPLWRYNLIKWFRGGKILEQTEHSGADD